ncbi:uncharacterized protein LOC110909163 isoform X2 [Helianthus annuus]|uniref:uncharacterized protein LOC110909163 isoform X2 n=1 Tax=Helianthus annuus TaxID=4232 RepID=UPI000B8F9F60|nr:uncharacterized protein LOC110909163 isoform X2 [Helianthus annuus]XP_022009875.1 uncharacterized protein LOC110909163 isoform X2 [Helianthus annuus]XP_022009876.1 uncharacterized protein LOC110909163 isoform X2 [Helianthus annuus]XP_035838698.1 uncharacterized protein LOC110909163 isoform X2 [Helianthus annuus]XP_035838699.1 uncharacterized protein LOC110909163 isoform X2 [Helianthus annuus]
MRTVLIIKMFVNRVETTTLVNRMFSGHLPFPMRKSYPKDSEKIMRQTGLARSQIADCRLVYKRTRVHAFGIMVEMYKEEFGDEEVNCESSPEQAASF